MKLNDKRQFPYNKTRHLELLKASPIKIHSKGTTSSSQIEIDENFFELQSYAGAMSEGIHYQNKFYYVELIETMLKSPDFDGFTKLANYYNTVGDFAEKMQDSLILVEPDDKSDGFELLIGDLIMYFDLRDELSDEEFRASIQTIFSELKQNYFD